MVASLQKEAPALIIDLGIGVVGFVLSVLWGKLTGRMMDRGTVSFLVKMWGAIALFGLILAFII